jgi:hypothetical protein
MKIRLDGKNCLVTGANSGLGFATAEGLASRYEPIPYWWFSLGKNILNTCLYVMSQNHCFILC